MSNIQFSPVVFTDVPLVITSDTPDNYIPSIMSLPQLPLVQPVYPFVTSSNPIVSYPIHPSLDLNNDKELQKKVTKYYYYKTLDKWLKKQTDMLDILNYFRIVNGNVELIGNIKDYNSKNIEKDTQQDIDKKVDYIEKNILTREAIYDIVKKYVRETSTNWYDLYDKSTFFIKELIKRYLHAKIVNIIETNKK